MRVLGEICVRAIIWATARSVYRFNVSGRENIPAEGPALLVANHVSFIDWLFISAALRRPVRFVMDELYFRGHIVRAGLTMVRVIPIAGPRENPQRLEEAYRKIAEELARGELVCIFPEGKISRDGCLSEFKPGVMKALKESPVPVIPMALGGLWGSLFSHEGGAPFRKWPRRLRAPVHLKIGAPLTLANLTLAGIRGAVASLRDPSEPRAPQA